MKRLAIQPHDAADVARGFGPAGLLGWPNCAMTGVAAIARRQSPRANP